MTPLAHVTITSFGYGHGRMAGADVEVDVRARYLDPHFDPRLKNLDATDDRVREVVLTTPGVEALIRRLADLAVALARVPMPVKIAVGCTGGRHRAPAIAEELYRQLLADGLTVVCKHRDMHRAVLTRPGDHVPEDDVVAIAGGVGRGWGPLPDGDRQAITDVAAALSQRGGEDDPRRIDWDARQRDALIPFRVVDGRPVNPSAPTGVRYGRGGLWHWGEGQAADAIVLATGPDGIRRLLMVQRSDGHGWAIPGGHVDPGETGLEAAIRELAEETGLRIPGASWEVLAPRIVPDPRATDEAWMVTTPAVTDLGEVAVLPEVCGDDDADAAAWIPAGDYDGLAEYLSASGGVFAAHRDLIRAVLDGTAR